MIALWTIEYLDRPVRLNRAIARLFAESVAFLSATARDYAQSLVMAAPMDEHGVLCPPTEHFYTRPIEEIRYGRHGETEAIDATLARFNPLSSRNLLLQTLLQAANILDNPGTASAEIAASAVRPTGPSLGPYTEPDYVIEERGYTARCLDECTTVAALFCLEARDLPQLVEFTKIQTHREAVHSVQLVTDKRPQFREVAGTFGHVVADYGFSFPGMARSMDRVYAQIPHGERSSHDVFHIRDFYRFYRVQ